MKTKQINYKKGNALEKRFASYCLTELDYDSYQLKYKLRIPEKLKGTKIDIIGWKINKNGKKNKHRGEKLFYIGIISLLLGLLEISIIDDILVGLPLILFFIILEALSFLAHRKSRMMGIEHIWVECSHAKAESNAVALNQMLQKIAIYQNSDDGKLNIIEFAFVSLSGFTNDAIEFAKRMEIKCYTVNEKGEFIRQAETINNVNGQE